MKLNLYITQKSTKDGKKFNSYKTRNTAGRWAEVKFTQEAGNPKSSFYLGEGEHKKGYSVIEIDKANSNLTHKTIGDKKYPVIWVKAFIKAPKEEQTAFEEHIKKVQAEYNAKQDKLFDDFMNGVADTETDEELPF